MFGSITLDFTRLNQVIQYSGILYYSLLMCARQPGSSCLKTARAGYLPTRDQPASRHALALSRQTGPKHPEYRGFTVGFGGRARPKALHLTPQTLNTKTPQPKGVQWRASIAIFRQLNRLRGCCIAHNPRGAEVGLLG